MMSIVDFKQSCIYDAHDIVVQKFLIEGNSYFFSEVNNDISEFDFKKNLSLLLGVHIRDIAIVGSGKLGFSLKPAIEQAGLYEYKEFDHNFKRNSTAEKSDLDIAVVSSTLFDKEMKNLFEHTNFYREDYVKSWGNRNSLAKFFLMGRLATRFFPSDFKLTREIENVQERYKDDFGRTVNIEIYKSWFFFESYHKQNIQNIHLNLIA